MTTTESRALQGAERSKDRGEAEFLGEPLLTTTESIKTNSKSDASSKREHAFFRIPMEEIEGTMGKLTWDVQ